MFGFFELLRDFWVEIIALFNNNPVSVAGYQVSVLSIIFAFLVIGFVISFFWKGAKT